MMEFLFYTAATVALLATALALTRANAVHALIYLIVSLLAVAVLFFLMGADSLADFPNWHRPADICRLATPLVVQRAGLPPPDFQTLEPFVDSQRLEAIRQSLVEMPPTPISSSQIRSLIATRGEWQALVPDAAAGYIESNQLYVDQR